MLAAHRKRCVRKNYRRCRGPKRFDITRFLPLMHLAPRKDGVYTHDGYHDRQGWLALGSRQSYKKVTLVLLFLSAISGAYRALAATPTCGTFCTYGNLRTVGSDAPAFGREKNPLVGACSHRPTRCWPVKPKSPLKGFFISVCGICREGNHRGR